MKIFSLKSFFKSVYWRAKSKLHLNNKNRKLSAELSYWYLEKSSDQALSGDWYEYYFTEHFDLDKNFYCGKHILDLGCGPKGSLDWCKVAEKKVGLDPLAEHYKTMSTADMDFIKGTAEKMPFEDNSFDIVSCFNSLDHFEDAEKAISEIKG